MCVYIYTHNSCTAVTFFMKIIVWLDVYFDEHSHSAVSGIAYCVPKMDQLSCRDHPSYRVGCFVETVHFVDITSLVVIGYVVWIRCLIEIIPLTGIGCFVETICFVDISGLVGIRYVVWISCLIWIAPLAGIVCFVWTVVL